MKIRSASYPGPPLPPHLRNSESKDYQEQSTIQERVSVLVQALRLMLRHLEGTSGINDNEMKEYIKIILKVY